MSWNQIQEFIPLSQNQNKLKTFKYLLLVLSIFLIAFSVAVYTNTPSLPDQADKIINQAQSSAMSSFKGEQAVATSFDGTQIWYESFGEALNPTLVLVMGHSSSALVWSEAFIQPILDKGYRVIRYDNRGVGMSDWIEDWTPENAYTLEDMSKDVIAILDDQGIEKAHVMGASMGGMIVQRLAISHSDRISSMTSIMSSGFYGDPDLTQLTPGLALGMVGVFTRAVVQDISTNSANRAKMMMQVVDGLKGQGYETNYASVASMVNQEISTRKGFNDAVGDQHTKAIELSGSRIDELGSITVPSLLIHGRQDPLILPEHAEKYFPLIPKAKQLWIEKMGHDMPEHAIPMIHSNWLAMVAGDS